MHASCNKEPPQINDVLTDNLNPAFCALGPDAWPDLYELSYQGSEAGQAPLYQIRWSHVSHEGPRTMICSASSVHIRPQSRANVTT